jgi:hypothetical protein
MRVTRRSAITLLSAAAIFVILYTAVYLLAAPTKVSGKLMPGGLLLISFHPPRAFTPDHYIVTLPICLDPAIQPCTTVYEHWEGRSGVARQEVIALNPQELRLCQLSVSACTESGRCGPFIVRSCR